MSNDSPLTGGRDFFATAQGHVEPSEEPLIALLRIIPRPACVYDTATLALLEVNDSFVERYGYSRIEIPSLTMADVWPAEDVPARLAELASSGQANGKHDFQRHRAKGGAVIPVETRSASLVYAGRDARVLIAEEVSDRRGAEDELVPEAGRAPGRESV